MRAPERRRRGNTSARLESSWNPPTGKWVWGGRLIREVFNIAAKLGLAKVAFELVVQREKEAARAAERVGFKEVATLEDRIKDCWGNYQDVMILEIPVADRKRW